MHPPRYPLRLNETVGEKSGSTFSKFSWFMLKCEYNIEEKSGAVELVPSINYAEFQ